MIEPQRLNEGQYFGNLIRRQDHPWGSCSLVLYDPRAAIAPHYHVNNYVSLLVKGAYLEQGREENTRMDVGQIIYRPSQYTHANHFHDTGGVCFNIEFKEEWTRQLENKHRLPDKVHPYPTGAFPALYKLFHHFREDALAGSAARGKEDFAEQFIHLYDQLTNAPIQKRRLSWVQNVKAILDNESDTVQTLDSIAQRVFVHPIYMARVFRERTGLTIGEYQLRCRLRKAAALLAQTILPVVQIAFQTGFYDASHFSRSFKLEYRFTPSQYRALHKS